MARTTVTDKLAITWADKSRTEIRFINDMFNAENPALYEILKAVAGTEAPRVLLAADSNVVHRTEGLGTQIGKYVQTYGIRLAGSPVVLGGGEKAKSDDWQSVKRIMASMLESKVGVSDIVLAIGGGSVLDAVGYVAAQVRGGTKIVRVPTTPAAMVDAAYAEYAAIDQSGVKDALRIAQRPAAVVVDVSFADTVLDGVWRGGIGEMVRHAAVSDPTLMKKIAKSVEALRERDMDTMVAMVRSTVESRVKKGTTDFAQWSALRLESMSDYKLPHGYAVPIGICIDCAYAVDKGLMKEEDQDFVCRALAECGALDGLQHSHHILSQADRILFGLDAWALSSGSSAVALPAGIGRSCVELEPDRDAYKKVIKEFLAVSSAQ